MSLDLTGLRVVYPSGVVAVDGVTLTVAPGEVVALVGESGSGKSSLAAAVPGLLPAGTHVHGSIVADGRELARAHDRELASARGSLLSMIFQDPVGSLNPLMTVRRQLQEACTARSGMSPADLLDATGISDPEWTLARYPHELSGGMCQRVMIAMAIAGGPRYLVADEPTTALDVSVQARILDLLRDIVAKRGLGVLFVTHDMGVVADIADRVVVLRDGRVVETGDVFDMFDHPETEYTRALIDASLSPLGQEAR